MAIDTTEHQGDAVDGYVAVFELNLAESDSLFDNLKGNLVVSCGMQDNGKII